jgi:hypothetical protein
MSGYEKLKIYQQALQGVKLIHQLIHTNPQFKSDFELKDQNIKSGNVNSCQHR